MKFDLKSTTIYRIVKTAKKFPLNLVKSINWLFLFLALLLLIFWIKKFLFSGLSSAQLLGLFLIILSFDIFGWIWLIFFEIALKKNIYTESLLKVGTSLDKINLAEYLNFDIAYAITTANNFCQRKKIPFSVIYIILFLSKNEKVKRIFRKLGISRDDIKQVIKNIKKNKQQDNSSNNQEFIKVIEGAGEKAVANFHKRIKIKDFLVTAAEYNKDFSKLLFDNDLEVLDLDHVISWDDFITYKAEWKKKFWKLDNLLKKPGIGKQWAAGYTVNVDRYAVDITKLIARKNLPLHIIGRKKEIESIERILSRRGENNVLVIGRPGGGRSTIVYSFAKKVLNGKSVSVLNYKRVLELDMQAMFAGLKTAGEILERFKVVFSEAANAGNIILIIDNIHNYIGKQEGVGSFDISSALTPYMGLSNLQIIGITTFEGLHKRLEANPAIMNSFEKVEIKEPSKEETMFILEDLLPSFEKRYGLEVSYKALRNIVKFADCYIQDVPFPQKAINLLGETMIYVKIKTRAKVVLSEHPAQIISEKTKIPAGEIQKPEKEKLLKLEEFIHRRIINQKEAVNFLADAMRRARAGVSRQEKPIGTFLFLGPTGVGKTETSKALAESYFGSEKRMIRLDMSEYQELESISRLIGSPDGKEQGQLTNAIRENPFSLVLLDEIEKAHPKILNLFLQVLDEGRLTDNSGRTVSFRNSIIIGTSNAGAEFIRKYVGEKADYAYSFFKKELTEHLLEKRMFRPEFLNRFDAVVVFNPLSKKNLIDIANLMLQRLSKRLSDGKGIRFIATKELTEKIAELGYHPEFGARPMNRVIQDRIESKIARRILEGGLKRGDVIEMKAEEI